MLFSRQWRANEPVLCAKKERTKAASAGHHHSPIATWAALRTWGVMFLNRLQLGSAGSDLHTSPKIEVLSGMCHAHNEQNRLTTMKPRKGANVCAGTGSPSFRIHTASVLATSVRYSKCARVPTCHTSLWARLMTPNVSHRQMPRITVHHTSTD